MADFSTELPVRSQLPGQTNYDDILVKVADGTAGATQLLGVDASGRVTVKLDDGLGNPINSQTLSTTQWLQVVDPANGSAAGGTAAVFSTLVGGIYNSTPPTLTTGQQASLQLTAAGALIVSATLPYDTNYGTVGAETLRTAAQIGNATGAADFNLGATGAQTLRVSANQGEPSTVSNAWPIKVTDGTNTAAITPASTAATATEPALVVALSPNSPLPTGSNTIGTVNVSNFPTTVDTNYGTVGANTIRTASQIGNATGAADFNNGVTDAQTLRVAANLAVGGANVSNTNPVPVTITTSAPGTAIQSYFTSVALAAAASVTFTYTVAATHTFNLERIWATASGKIKIIVQNNASTIYAAFNSTADPNIDITVISPPTVAAGNTVTVTVTNMDLVPFDVYATVEGNQN
jgi:hypothetical protein